jgi:hypothetical protein
MKCWSLLRYLILGNSLAWILRIQALLGAFEIHRSFLTCLIRVITFYFAWSLNFLLTLLFQGSSVGLGWVPFHQFGFLKADLVRWLWVFDFLLLADISNNVVKVILFKYFVLSLQLLDLPRDFLCGFRAQIWQKNFWFKLFLHTMVEFFHNLADLLNAFWNSLIV